MPVECTEMGAFTKAEESLQLQHRPLRSGGKDTVQGTGSGEDPTIHTPPMVEQIADGNLKLLLLGGCGGWRSKKKLGRYTYLHARRRMALHFYREHV
jgi:hypothetical protein